MYVWYGVLCGLGGSARGAWSTAGNSCLIMAPLCKQHVGTERQWRDSSSMLASEDPPQLAQS